MNRRELLKLMAATGITAGLPLGHAAAASCSGGPKYFISFAVKGGWDVTQFCDPKGNHLTVNQDSPINKFDANQVRGAMGKPGFGYRADTPFSWAPIGLTKDVHEGYDTEELFEKFFIDMANEHGMTVINGVDAETNGHVGGTRGTFSGTLLNGYPNIGALYAAITNPDVPLPFLTFGGYDGTASLVPLARVGDPTFFEQITDHNVSNLSEAENLKLQALSRKQNARAAEEAIGFQRRLALSRFVKSKSGEFSVKSILERAPKYSTDNPLKQNMDTQLPLGSAGGYLNADPDILQAELMATAFCAGLTVSGNLFMKGADSHGNNDINQLQVMTKVARIQERFWQTAKQMDDTYGTDITKSTTMIMGSEFGRTPWYNNGQGKDHWPTTSVILSGYGIEGTKLIGESSDTHKPIKVKPDSLALDPNESSADSVRINNSMIHVALRKQILCINDHLYSRQYNIQGNDPELPLFT